jgi:hypothetical protein
MADKQAEQGVLGVELYREVLERDDSMPRPAFQLVVTEDRTTDHGMELMTTNAFKLDTDDARKLLKLLVKGLGVRRYNVVTTAVKNKALNERGVEEDEWGEWVSWKELTL